MSPASVEAQRVFFIRSIVGVAFKDLRELLVCSASTAQTTWREIKRISLKSRALTLSDEYCTSKGPKDWARRNDEDRGDEGRHLPSSRRVQSEAPAPEAP